MRAPSATARQLSLFDLSTDAYQDLHARWDNVTAREQRSRTLFAQRSIDASEVAREWEAVHAATGTTADVERFVADAITACGGSVARKAAARAHCRTGGLRESAAAWTIRPALAARPDGSLLHHTPLVDGSA